MSKTWYNIITGSQAVFEDSEDIANWPDFQEAAPAQSAITEGETRGVRDKKLADTDWWAVSDRAMTAEQTAYRQSLRDLPTHANWPDLSHSDWPIDPTDPTDPNV